jgi:hypothetical protein
MQGLKTIESNDIADHLARMSSLHPFTGSEPACGISESYKVDHQGQGVHRAPGILAVHPRKKYMTQLLS